MIVFPGGVDVHTHVAGGAINFARAMTPEDHRRTQAFIRTKSRRSGLGGMAPTTFATGYLYAGMGWTTVNEAAVPVLSARHTHEELADIPIVDKSSLTLMANNEIMLDQLEKGEYERAKQVVAWYLWAAKSYGIKAVNPGGVAAWKWGKDAKQLTSPIEGYSKLTPGTIVTQLARICDELGLPHPMHLHCNNLGAPGNISTTLDTLKHLEGHRAHIAHSQYHAYGGDGWDTMCSATTQLAEYFNTHPNITTDAGAVLFGDTVTITADGPWQHVLYKLTGRKWGNLDVENETGCGIVPYYVQTQHSGQRRAMGGRLGTAAVDPQSVAGVSLDRSSERRLLLAVSGDHRAADVRGRAEKRAFGNCPTRSKARSRCRRSIASTRCMKLRFRCRPVPHGRSA